MTLFRNFSPQVRKLPPSAAIIYGQEGLVGETSFPSKSLIVPRASQVVRNELCIYQKHTCKELSSTHTMSNVKIL